MKNKKARKSNKGVKITLAGGRFYYYVRDLAHDITDAVEDFVHV